jgi:hypothetical protein
MLGTFLTITFFCEDVTSITLFRAITMFYHTNNILQNIPHIQSESEKYSTGLTYLAGCAPCSGRPCTPANSKNNQPTIPPRKKKKKRQKKKKKNHDTHTYLVLGGLLLSLAHTMCVNAQGFPS